MNQRTFSDDALIRSNNYRQLYHLFDYPEGQSGINMVDTMIFAYPDNRDCLELTRIQEEISGALEKCSSNEEIEAEYVRLFDYRPLCAVNETAYHNELRAYQFIADLVDIYQNAGISCDETTPPDQLSVELEFMHYLCHKEAISSQPEKDKWREKQKIFFKNHILSWVPTVSDTLIRKASSPYCFLGELVELILTAETIWLGITENHAYDNVHYTQN